MPVQHVSGKYHIFRPLVLSRYAWLWTKIGDALQRARARDLGAHADRRLGRAGQQHVAARQVLRARGSPQTSLPEQKLMPQCTRACGSRALALSCQRMRAEALQDRRGCDALANKEFSNNQPGPGIKSMCPPAPASGAAPPVHDVVGMQAGRAPRARRCCRAGRLRTPCMMLLACRQAAHPVHEAAGVHAGRAPRA